MPPPPPGEAVDRALSPRSVDKEWENCMEQVVKAQEMWALMTCSVEEGACSAALAKHAITDISGLYRLADERFSTMNTRSSGDAALDAMVAAAAFARGSSAPIRRWLEEAASVQENHVCGHNDALTDPYEDMVNLDELLCHMDGENFGFDPKAICDGFVALFDKAPSDRQLVAALEEVGTMEF